MAYHSYFIVIDVHDEVRVPPTVVGERDERKGHFCRDAVGGKSGGLGGDSSGRSVVFPPAPFFRWAPSVRAP